MSKLHDDYLIMDYQQKAQFLTGHLSRMWIRYNFFIVLETALAAALFARAAPGSNTTFSVTPLDFALTDLAISIMWYLFTVNDRYLATAYREQVKLAKRRIMGTIKEQEDMLAKIGPDTSQGGPIHQAEPTSQVALLAHDAHIGELLYLKDGKQIPKTPWGWRFEWISLSKLAAAFTLLVCLYWLGWVIYFLNH